LIQTNEYIPFSESTAILDHLASVPELTVTNDDLATAEAINKMSTIISEPPVNPDHLMNKMITVTPTSLKNLDMFEYNNEDKFSDCPQMQFEKLEFITKTRFIFDKWNAMILN